MKDVILSEDFPVSVDEFYTLCFKDPEFTLLFHEKQGNSDAQVGQWSVAPEGRKMRVVRFVSPTASSSSMRKMAGVTTRVKEIHLSHFTADGAFILSSTALFEKAVVDIDSRTKWHITPKPDGLRGCTCTITASSDFKGNLFKESFEKYVDDNSRIAYIQWLELAREKIKELAPVHRLQPQMRNTKTNSPMVNRQQMREHITRNKFETRYGEGEGEGEREREKEGDESEEEEDGNNKNEFFDSNDEMVAVVRLDASATIEERLAILEAYSRSTQNEMDHMEQSVLTVQARVMRVENTLNTVPTMSPMYHEHEASYGKHQQQGRGRGNSMYEEDRDREEGIQRELALQRTLSNTERRLAELEQTLARIQKQQELVENKKRSLFSSGWVLGVPVLVFIFCWPLVSHKVVNSCLGWGSHLFLQLHRFFSQRFN